MKPNITGGAAGLSQVFRSIFTLLFRLPGQGAYAPSLG